MNSNKMPSESDRPSQNGKVNFVLLLGALWLGFILSMLLVFMRI